MARTTEAEVLEIMDNDLTEAQVTPYLTSANIFVTNALGSTSLSDSVLEEIERWFTAHMIAVTKDRLGIEEQAGTAMIKYMGKYGEGLSSTPYGQMVLLLDTTDTLTDDLTGKKSAWVKAVDTLD